MICRVELKWRKMIWWKTMILSAWWGLRQPRIAVAVFIQLHCTYMYSTYTVTNPHEKLYCFCIHTYLLPFQWYKNRVYWESMATVKWATPQIGYWKFIYVPDYWLCLGVLAAPVLAVNIYPVNWDQSKLTSSILCIYVRLKADTVYGKKKFWSSFI